MKFLLMLTVLASTSVFAQGMGSENKISCWDSAQENGHRKPVYVFEEKGRYDAAVNREIKLVYPKYVQLEEKHGCLVARDEHGGEPANGFKFKACLGEGQEHRRLIPVEIEYEYDRQEEEATVYCERDILDFLRDGRRDNT